MFININLNFEIRVYIYISYVNFKKYIMWKIIFLNDNNSVNYAKFVEMTVS